MNFISYRKRISSPFSAPLPVHAARRAFAETCAWAGSGGVGTCGIGVCGVCSPRLQPRFLRFQRDPAVPEHEAGDADGAASFRFVEGGAAVAKAQKFLEQAHMRTYVYYFISVEACDLLFHMAAVGAAGHTVNLYHRKRTFNSTKYDFPRLSATLAIRRPARVRADAAFRFRLAISRRNH